MSDQKKGIRKSVSRRYDLLNEDLKDFNPRVRPNTGFGVGVKLLSADPPRAVTARCARQRMIPPLAAVLCSEVVVGRSGRERRARSKFLGAKVMPPLLGADRTNNRAMWRCSLLTVGEQMRERALDPA